MSPGRTSEGLSDVNLELDVKIEDPRDRRQNARRGQRGGVDSAAATTSQPTSSTRPGGQAPDDDENIDEIEEEIVLKYGAQHVIKLFIPVTLCLVFVILSLSLIKSYQKSDGATL